MKSHLMEQFVAVDLNTHRPSERSQIGAFMRMPWAPVHGSMTLSTLIWLGVVLGCGGEPSRDEAKAEASNSASPKSKKEQPSDQERAPEVPSKEAASDECPKIECPKIECPRSEPEKGKDHSEVHYGDDTTNFPTHGNTLADALTRIGITPKKIEYLRFVGDEHSQTMGRTHYVRDVSWIWDHMFRTAEPYKYWVASGNRVVEIYVKGRPNEPAATLRVNETDRTEIDGIPGSYIANGFEQLVMHGLRRGGQAKSSDANSMPKKE